LNPYPIRISQPPCLYETVDNVEELDEEVNAQLGEIGGQHQDAHLKGIVS
jgi:hypothetical protein